MPEHAFPLVREVLETLRSAGLDAWLFGGWAEEVRGMRPPGAHADIDLLLRAADFAALEALLAGRAGVAEILEKRFSHKRAYEWGGVRVELFLVEDGPSQRTALFDGRAVVHWPPDTFTEALVDGLPVASKSALALYRRDHKQVVRAYAAFHGQGGPA